MILRYRSPDVQGRGSKTDAARSHSCRRTEEKSRGQQRRKKRSKACMQSWKDKLSFCLPIMYVQHSSLLPKMITFNKHKKDPRESPFLLYGLLYHYILQSVTDPRANTLCRSNQGWESLERVYLYVCVFVSDQLRFSRNPWTQSGKMLAPALLPTSSSSAGLSHLSLIHFTFTFIF